jgi:hypothetical protein
MSNKAKPTNAQAKAQPKPQSKLQPANTTKQIVAVGNDAVEITITTRPVPAPIGTKPKSNGATSKETAAAKPVMKRTPPKKK